MSLKVSLLIACILLTLLVPTSSHPTDEINFKNSSIGLDQLQVTDYDFFSVSASDIGIAKSLIENTIKVVKPEGWTTDMRLTLDGDYFYPPDDDNDGGLVETEFIGPDHKVISHLFLSDEELRTHEFLITEDDYAGLYTLRVSVGYPADGVGCCRDFTYKINYRGLPSPPIVQGQAFGHNFGYHSGKEYVPIRNDDGGLVQLGFYGEELVEYEFEFQPWNPNDGLVESVEVVDELGNRDNITQTAHIGINDLKIYNFNVSKKGYYHLDVNTSNDEDFWANIYGLRLRKIDESELYHVIPLYAGKIFNDVDSDGDMILDVDEIEYGTYINQPDSDFDGNSDGIEILVGTDPLDDSLKPIEMRAVYTKNNEELQYELILSDLVTEIPQIRYNLVSDQEIALASGLESGALSFSDRVAYINLDLINGEELYLNDVSLTLGFLTDTGILFENYKPYYLPTTEITNKSETESPQTFPIYLELIPASLGILVMTWWSKFGRRLNFT